MTVNENSSQRSLSCDESVYSLSLTCTKVVFSEDSTDLTSTQNMISVVNGLFQEMVMLPSVVGITEHSISTCAIQWV